MILSNYYQKEKINFIFLKKYFIGWIFNPVSFAHSCFNQFSLIQKDHRNMVSVNLSFSDPSKCHGPYK